jgi:hypothetical protein
VRRALVIALALASCAKNGTFVHVTVAPGPVTASVYSLELQLMLAGASDSKTYREPGGGPIQLPTDLVVQIGSASGTLSVTAIARDVSDSELARGSNMVTVVSGKTVELAITLGSSSQPTVPTVPLNFTATLRWAAPASDGGSPLTGYSITAAPSITQIDVGPMVTQAQATNLTVGTTYTFTLVANNAIGASPGATAMATIVDAPAPVVTACRYQSENRIFWPPVAGASGYNVYFATAPGVTKTSGQAGTMVSSPFKHTSLTNGTTYYYRVTSVVSGVEGALSNEVSSTPATYVVPTNTVYAVNHVANGGSVYIWDGWLTGMGANPSRTIGGPTNSNLSAPIVGVFVDREAGLLYVGNGEASNAAPPSRRVNVYASSANGDVAPLRTLQDGDLQRVRGVVVDTTRNILYVVNQSQTIGMSEIVSIDDACHFAGTPTARAHIAGATSGLYFPTQIALSEATDELYVANYQNALVFKNASQLTGTPAVAPSRIITINGNATTLEAQGIAIDTTANILYLANQGRFNAPARTVLSFDSASTLNGTVTPPRVITLATTAAYPVGIHVAANTLLMGSDADGPNFFYSFAPANTASGNPATGVPTPSAAFTACFTGVFYVP